MDEKRLYQETFSQLHSSAQISGEKFAVRKRPARVWKRTVILAAAVCALLCCGAAAAGVAYWFNLKDMVLRDHTPEEFTTNPPQETAVISLQGYSDSPEYQAMVESDCIL